MNDVPFGLPVIVGTATEDQNLAVDTTGISDNDGVGTFNYQWLRNGIAISGASSSTYALGDADVNTNISVEVSYTDGNGTIEGPLTSAQTAAVLNVNDMPVGLPVIVGTVEEDQTISADVSAISDNDGLGAFSYQWRRDGIAISGATTNAYTLTDVDVAANISVEVTYTDGWGTSEGPLTSATRTVAGVNDAPVNTVPGNQTVVEETQTAITGISIADIDANGLDVTTQLQVINGVLDVTLSGMATIFAGGNSSADLTISGTVADINATLASLLYTPNLNVIGMSADMLTVTTNDGGNTGSGGALQDVDTVQISISNVNDEEVLSTNLGTTVNEGDLGSVVTRLLLETTDVDNTPTEIVYSLTAVPTSGSLQLNGINLATGQTFTQADINANRLTYDHNDAEVFSDSFAFRVDDGSGTISSGTFAITITPVNDKAPVITSDGGPADAAITIAENTTAVTLVTATDADLPIQTLTFSIAGGPDSGLFTIDSGSGALAFATASSFETPLDADGNNVYEVVVEVNDGQGLTSQQTVRVTVTDTDEFDVTPIVDNNSAANNIDENLAVGTTVGITAFSEDLDGTSNAITYSLDDDAAGLFNIDSLTGEIRTAASIDFETVGASLNIVVRATSADDSTTTQAYTITVNDLDEFDVTPVVDTDSAANNIDENIVIGSTVGITAFSEDLDATTNVITYSLDNNAGGLFAINSSTGVVTTANNIDYEVVGSVQNIIVRATSQDGSTATQAYSITINDLDEFDVSPIVDTNAAANNIDEIVPVGTLVGITAFSEDLDGTSNAITYSLDDDAAGLFNIDSLTGEIRTAASIDFETVGASLNIVVRATSADDSTTTQAYIITVNDL
ncbi:MAG: cadherin domain-containing protein, partial [Fuerstiella sp.]